ncbi:MAG: hypothetical protein IJ809_01690 [Clostridia bacterium]|nr:hypothetical protein [Clostridia bacterium]
MIENENMQNDDNMKKKITDNGVLVISEIQKKVILPYTKGEVKEIYRKNKELYKDEQDVIEKEFTKDFYYYRHQFTSRFREAVELITKREGMSKLDGFNLGSELFLKSYLHPAIISACKNLDELNVYLDCLDKNELDDFKVFDIKYELYPAVISKNDIGIYEKETFFKRLSKFFRKMFKKCEYN